MLRTVSFEPVSFQSTMHPQVEVNGISQASTYKETRVWIQNKSNWERCMVFLHRKCRLSDANADVFNLVTQLFPIKKVMEQINSLVTEK